MDEKKIRKYDLQLDQIAENLITGGMTTYYQSLAQINNLVALSESLSIAPINARSLHLQGRILNRMGRDDEALRSLLKAQEMCEGLPGLKAQVFDSMARFFSSHNQITLAESYFKKALALKNEIGDKLGEAISLQGLAIHYEELGDVSQSTGMFKKSLKCHQAIQNIPGIANVQSRIVRQLIESGQYEQADRFLQAAEKITPSTIPSFGHNLASKAEIQWHLYSKKDDEDVLFKKSIQHFRRNKDLFGNGNTEFRWGHILELQNDSKAAARHYRKALRLFEDSGDRGWHAQTYLALDKISEKVPLAKRIAGLKTALKMAHEDGTVPCQRKIEERFKEISEAEYLQMMVGFSSPGMTTLATEYIAGRREQATLLFADIEGYSAISEKREPNEVFGILNGVYDTMQKSFDETDGIVGCHMGDGIMVMFLQKHGDDHANRAVDAGKRILRDISAFNRISVKGGNPYIRIRVGIHSGSSLVGRVGAKNRWTFTAIGATTNMAARLESRAKPGTVLMSGATFNALSDQAGISSAGSIKVKGFSEAIDIFSWKESDTKG